jgi:PAS domain S-box-containing protein
MAEGIRVLHVDDDPAFAELTATSLEREAGDLDVTTAHDAATGHERLAEDDVDCVVSDYEMPGTDGIEFLERVREDDPDLPFVLFTGEGSEEIASEAISAGVTDYVRKRVGAEQFTVLANRVTNAVDQRRTEQQLHRRERELERQNNRLLVLFENFPEPTVEYVYEDREPHIVAVNEAFTEAFGYDSEAAVGEPVDDLIVPQDHEVEANEIDERVRNGEMVDEILERKTTDGLRTFRFRNVRLSDDEAIDGYGIYADVTDRVRRERELQRQNERLEEFAQVVSHDLRNPLRVAEGRLSLVRDECDSDHLDDVERAHDRMETLVDDLLTFAREGDPVDDVAPVELGPLVETCWEHVGATDGTLAVETDLTVRADRGRLQRLLENLLANAVEHGGTDVAVTVDTLDDDEGFFVADDGPGVPPDARVEVFESGYSTAGDGTGLGLAIVQGIAEAHGWRAEATESEAGGARFAFTGVDGV